MENGLVLDTSAYTGILLGDHQVTIYIESIEHIFIPSIVVGELMYGFRKGNRFKENYDIFQRFNSVDRVSVVEINQAIAERYGALKLLQQSSGQILADNDLWIAAVSLYLKQPLLTFDSDFGRVADIELQLLAV